MADLPRHKLALVRGCAEKRLSARELSVRIGKNPSYLGQYLSRKAVPRSLPEDVVQKIARLLGIHPQEIRDPETAALIESASHAPGAPGPVAVEEPATVARFLPILGRAMAGSPDLIAWNDGRSYGRTVAPRYLDDVPDAFAIEVSGDSMEPALRAGWLCYIHPYRTVKPGDLALVEWRDAGGDHVAYIKEVVGWEGEGDAQELVLRQYHPAKTIRLRRRQVVEIRKVEGARFSV